jgi:hypothetical protein
MGENISQLTRKEEIQIVNKYTKKISISVYIREMEIKTSIKYHLHLTAYRMGIIKKS